MIRIVLCKGGCGNKAVYKGWCGISWKNGRKVLVTCPKLIERKGKAISKYRLKESKLGLNPMQNPKICKKNHSLERNRKASESLKKLGKLGLLPQQTESKRLRERRLRRIRKVLRKLAKQKRLPQQIESKEKRKERYRRISEGVSKAILEGRLKPTPNGKKTKYLCKNGNGFIFRSGWEKEMAKLLDSLNIKWLYEPFKIPYYDTKRKINVNMIPDFYIPSKNLIIEVKGYPFHPQKTKDKIKSLKNKNYKFMMIQEKDIYAIRKGEIDFILKELY